MVRIMFVNPNKLKPHPKNAEIYFDLNDGLDESIRQHGILRPIVVNQDFVILDGHRRWVRAKKLGLNEIPIEIRDFENEIIALIELNRYRVKQPREIYNESRVLNREFIVPNLEQCSNGRVIEKVAKKVGVSKGQLYKIQKIYNNENEIPETVKKLDTLKISVHQAYKEQQQAEHKTQPSKIEIPRAAEKLPSDLFITNVWQLPESRPKGYGSEKFRGNCDPTIIDQCLRRYVMNPHVPDDAKILDPMAGSGTFIDVAKALGFKRESILAYDINQKREDIEPIDALDLPLDDRSLDLVFCHYPYWNMWKYSDDPRDLSTHNYEEFLRDVNVSFEEFYRVLKPKGYLCVLIGNKRESGVIDLESDLSFIGAEIFGFLWDKIITVVGDPAGHAHTAHDGWGVVQHRALKNKWTIQNYDTLLVFRK